MKAKTAGFYQDNVRPRARQAKKDGARWLLRNSVIFARLYENSQHKKGWFFAVKAKLTRFYMDKVEPKITALKAKAVQFKQRVTGRLTAAKAKAAEVKRQGREWLARRKRSLWLAAMIVAFLAVGVGLAYLWQRSPAFRTAVKTLSVAALGVLITLWALLKGLGLTVGEGLSGLDRGLGRLGAGALNFLGRLWSRFARQIINVIVVTRPAGDAIPVPPVDGRRGL